MQAKNKEEFMNWLKAWHDEHLDVYEAFRLSVAGAHEGKLDFFEHNTKMLDINVQEVADDMQRKGREVSSVCQDGGTSWIQGKWSP